MASKKSVYVPSPTITNFIDVQRELHRIQDALNTLAEHVATEKSTEKPDKQVDLQVRYADGTHWNPGQGAGLYIFVDGAWRKITIT